MAATMCGGRVYSCSNFLFRKTPFLQTFLYKSSVKLQSDKVIEEQNQNKAEIKETSHQNVITESGTLGQTEIPQFQRQQTLRKSLIHKSSYWSMVENNTINADRCNAISRTELQKVDKDIKDNLLVNFINTQSVILKSRNKQGQSWLDSQNKFTGYLTVGRSPFRINGILKEKETVNEQLMHLDAFLRQTYHHQLVYFMVYNEILKVVREAVSNDPAAIHGSSVTKLGCRGGDLDIVLSTDKENFNQIRNKLKHAASLKLESFFPWAKVPIIKVQHIPSNVICDISVGRVLKESKNNPVINCEMLYTMGALDERFCSLVRILKTWAAYRGLCKEGANALPHSVTWTMLTLFYLQQRQMLPAAKCLYEPLYLRQQSMDKLDDSSCDILCRPDVRRIKHLPDLAGEVVVNDDSLADLLKDLCGFYYDFNFKKNWISVYDGSSYPRITDLNSSRHAMVIPAEFPEFVNENVSKNVNTLVVKRMKSELRILYKAIDSNDLASVFETRPPPIQPRQKRKHSRKKENSVLQDMLFVH
ncbi:poly(A) RNA polymerase, mitochondrial-like isoform X2 [Argopecten irradians]|uniref:poly(A) RNA polymerase, mitochondrial-like isoform X2 n=1 Tax=Argopecten irradians TaxID=31199 RepID=UPI00371E8181